MYKSKFFRPAEFVNYEGMDEELLRTLDKLRECVRRPIYISESNPQPHADTQHMEHSLHWVGRAVDCHASDLPLWEFFLAATRLPLFTGIGVYPYWHSPGLHLEVGSLRDGKRGYWWRDREGTYRGISVHDLSSIFLTDHVSS